MPVECACGKQADLVVTEKKEYQVAYWCQECWDKARQPGYCVDYFPQQELANEFGKCEQALYQGPRHRRRPKTVARRRTR